jgi:hypothetical protein
MGVATDLFIPSRSECWLTGSLLIQPHEVTEGHGTLECFPQTKRTDEPFLETRHHADVSRKRSSVKVASGF